MIKSRLKAVAQRYPNLTNPIWKALYPRSKYNIHMARDASESRAEAFREIYHRNEWGSVETKSGNGSTLAATGPIRRKLPGLLRKFGCETLLDAPCGDFHWMRLVDLGPVKYIGADIVPDIIEGLNADFASERRSFQVLDIVSDPLPRADLWLCRDVLFHLPTRDVMTCLRNFVSSDIRYLLTSTFPLSTANPEIHPGGFRTINLRLPPFSLPRPLIEVDDYVPGFTPRVLGLWSNEQIKAWSATATGP